ncbi:hypothetical protein EDF56_103258 [Novosphingobium sp. PhB165]|nr:hypothetical protein EDF56_103258 [Novosphingobium sp. PhB165]
MALWLARVELGLGFIWFAMIFGHFVWRTYSRVMFGLSYQDIYYESPVFTGRYEDYRLVAVGMLVFAASMSGCAAGVLAWSAFRPLRRSELAAGGINP